MTMHGVLGPEGPDKNSNEETTGRAQVEALFRREAPGLVRFLKSKTGAGDEAQDLAQEAFLRLTRVSDAKVLANPAAYLQRIARNLIRDRFKSARQGFERSLVLFEPERHAANDSGPHEALEARQTLERYERAVMGLKPRTREIFLLHRLDKLTYEQIADNLEMSVGGVEKQMSKAIAHIDRALSR